MATGAGLTVKRTKADGRSLVEAAKERHVQLAAAMDGRFAFPAFQPNFDAIFTVGKTLELIARTGRSLGEIRKNQPMRAYRHLQLPCSWELKGGIRITSYNVCYTKLLRNVARLTRKGNNAQRRLYP